MTAEMGTPSGFSQSGSITGHWEAGAVNRALACDATRPQPGVQSLPCQSVSLAGSVSVIISHQTSSSGVSATLVKMEFRARVSMALGLDFMEVPGATPKKPASGLMA